MIVFSPTGLQATSRIDGTANEETASAICMPTQTTIYVLGLTHVAHLHRSKKAGAAWSD